MPIEAISSSAWITVPPTFGSSAARNSITSDAGVLGRQPEQGRADPDGDDVLTELELQLVLGDVGQRHRDLTAVVALGRGEVGRVVEQQPAVAQVLDVEVVGLLVEGQQDVDRVAL